MIALPLSRLLCRSLAAPAVRALLLLACGGLGAGCQAVGVIADKVAGPAPVEPMYVPGPTTQLLVIAENYRAPSQSASDSDRIARMVSDDLALNQAAMIISQEKLALVRDAKPGAFNRMSVVEVGKAVGAQQVLYIDIGGVAVGAQQGSDMLKGVGRASVKVIDVAGGGQVAFPTDMADGMPITFETPIRRATDAVNADAMRAEAIAGLSGRIARLFYRYKPSDLEALDTGL